MVVAKLRRLLTEKTFKVLNIWDWLNCFSFHVHGVFIVLEKPCELWIIFYMESKSVLLCSSCVLWEAFFWKMFEIMVNFLLLFFFPWKPQPVLHNYWFIHCLCQCIHIVSQKTSITHACTCCQIKLSFSWGSQWQQRN